MTAQILDGKATAATIKSELREIVSGMARKPGLGTILVGDDPGSHSYVGGKHKDCAEVGITSIRVDLPASAGQGFQVCFILIFSIDLVWNVCLYLQFKRTRFCQWQVKQYVLNTTT